MRPLNMGLALVLAAVVIPVALLVAWYASTRTQYFDPALEAGMFPCSLAPTEPPGPIRLSDLEGWFDQPLRAADEPSLYREKPPGSATTLRFTFLPAFTEPVIVRIDDLYGETPRLIATRNANMVHKTPGKNRIERHLKPAEVAPIIALIREQAPLNLPPDSCLTDIDGVIYLIEASGPEGYRFINRWGAQDGPIYDLSNAMYRLTGWPQGPQGPDRELSEAVWREWVARQ